ncbi:TIGR04255 family protein [Actinotalea sp. JY-7885]|uniref:TIGR04255 family protein n=1 Tax=Actinotalea sp. JY-7885 TaxID=2758576 RepID=UPI00165DF793|nr:TIGR04255 family protein [Actinotalea sp. JY-7885]
MDLPRYESEHLANSPLVLVAAQINFEEIGRGVSHGQARQLQRSLGSAWTHLESAPLRVTTMTPNGPVSDAPRDAYRLSTADGDTSALLNPDAVTIETRRYPGWNEMRSVVQAFAEAISSVYDPATEVRLGLRYVDQIPLPDGAEWQGLIPDSLLGIAQDERLSTGVLASDQRILLQLDDQTRAVMRHGLLADGDGNFGKVYLLDFDVYREGPRAYDVASLMEAADRLHSFGGQLFRTSITDELHSLLKG